MVNRTIRLRAPKNFRVRKVTVLGNIPRGSTTFKMFLSKGGIPIPFPKIVRVKGTGYRSLGGGRDRLGEYILYKKR